MSIRNRIFLAFLAVILGGFSALTWWITDDLRPRYMEALEEPLVDSAQLLAELLGEELRANEFHTLSEAFERLYRRKLDANIFGLRREEVDLRVYLTDRNGIVVFDSLNLAVGQDYSRWNDVYRTLQGQYGARSTLDENVDPEHALIYVAAPVTLGQEIIGVVSIGKPKRNVDRFFFEARRKFIIAGMVAAGLAATLAWWLYFWVSRPLSQLTRYVQQASDGKRVALPDLGKNEIAMMGQAIETMRRELEGRHYVERYVQSLTHEMKSPLAAIQGAAELLDENLPPERRTRFSRNIQDEARRLNRLIENLLQLAELEKAHALERRQLIRLGDLFTELNEDLKNLASERSVSLQWSNEGNPSVEGDPFLLRQALFNLVQNAIEFSPAKALIRIESRIQGETVSVDVTDQGPGIPDYALPRIFERFYSLARPGGSKSTGLGLSLVKQVIELHHGKIALRNNPQGGCTASLTLPLCAR